MSTISVASEGFPDSRSTFVVSARRAVALLGREEVALRWEEQSVLAEFSISALAGHLLRSLKTVDEYLAAGEPQGETRSAAGYYHAISLTPDTDSPSNRQVRERGAQEAAGGAAAVAAQAESLLSALESRLPVESPDRRMQVIGELVVTLDAYLRTRIVELVLHTDDLALSVGLAELSRPTPDEATIVIDTLVGTARLRNGDLAVMRALARRERDPDDALRVI